MGGDARIECGNLPGPIRKGRGPRACFRPQRSGGARGLRSETLTLWDSPDVRTGVTRAPRARKMIAHGFNRGRREKGIRVPRGRQSISLTGRVPRPRHSGSTQSRLPLVGSSPFQFMSGAAHGKSRPRGAKLPSPQRKLWVTRRSCLGVLQVAQPSSRSWCHITPLPLGQEWQTYTTTNDLLISCKKVLDILTKQQHYVPTQPTKFLRIGTLTYDTS